MLWLLILVVVPILFFVCLYLYLDGNTGYWPKRGVTLIKVSDVVKLRERLLFKLPFQAFDTRFYNKVRSMGLKYAGMLEFRNPTFFVTDLELTKHILVKDFDYFVNRRTFGGPKNDKYFGEMMSIKENQDWKDLRSTMSPTFTTGKIRRMFEIFEECGQKFDAFITKEQTRSAELDFRDVCSRFTMDVIASSAFGVDSQVFKDSNSAFSIMGKRTQNAFSGVFGIIKLMIFIFFPKLGKVLRVPFSDPVAIEFFANIIVKTRKYREETGEKRQDFLQLMLDAQVGHLKADTNEVLEDFEKDAQLGGNTKKIPLTDRSIIAQCLLFFLAGFDTTETLLIFAAYELACNPDIQEKLADEINKAVEQNNGKLTYDILTHLEYLDKFTSETLRVYSPGVRAERKSTADYKVPGTDFILPKDTVVVIPIYAIHHDAEYYPDPEKFDPERFSAENKAKRHPYAYMPFGQGPRNCIAMRFALIEGKTAIAHLVHNFILEPCSKTHIPMKFQRNGMMKPDGGMWLNVKPRRVSSIEE